ncbi:acyl-CoA carboxylase subunit epsilon [Streptomyces sp. NPDC057445]|uniref:acyl-CoA carboxylase subunit epsilon n=1 Tax=Streptomyces sp. NPDC057445 TaxID=3346136 RepID=UPI0036BE9D9E
MNCDVRIVHGDPDDIELAALMAVLSVVLRNREAAGAARGRRSRRAQWDRAWGGFLHPSGSWRVRDRTVTGFDPGSR